MIGTDPPVSLSAEATSLATPASVPAAVTIAFAASAASLKPLEKSRASRVGFSSKSRAPPVIVISRLGRFSCHGPWTRKVASSVGEVVSEQTR